MTKFKLPFLPCYNILRLKAFASQVSASTATNARVLATPPVDLISKRITCGETSRDAAPTSNSAPYRDRRPTKMVWKSALCSFRTACSYDYYTAWPGGLFILLLGKLGSKLHSGRVIESLQLVSCDQFCILSKWDNLVFKGKLNWSELN